MKKYWKLIQQHLGVDADGIPGPKTALALLDRLGIRQPEQSWPSQEEVRSGKSVFGRAGDESNMTSIKLPYIMRLAWETNTTVSTMRCHKLVAEPLVRIFQATLDHYGMEKIRELGLDLYGGCFNNRSIIGGKATSMHAWGNRRGHGPGQKRPEHPRAESGIVRTGVRRLLAIRGSGGGRIPGTLPRLRLDALPVRYSLTGVDANVLQPSSQRRRRAGQSSPFPPCPRKERFFSSRKLSPGRWRSSPRS